MSKTITITWDNTSPQPTCGYTAYFKRKGDSQYTSLDSSGSTSGTTSVSTIVTAPANFEGYVVSDCCDDTLSTQVPFGINSYVPFNVDVVNNLVIGKFVLTISSEYANPYDILVAGSFMSSVFGIITYSVTYPADSTSTDYILQTAQPFAVVSDIVVDSYAPVFDQGGELQQFDSVSTPSYTKFYWDGDTSGTTWNGSPASLPSFTLDSFTALEVDIDDNVLQGQLYISWIQEFLYNDAEVPYNAVTLEVYDGDNSLLGYNRITLGPLGALNYSIILTRASISFPLEGGQEFTMVAKWDDESVIDTYNFYLPTP